MTYKEALQGMRKLAGYEDYKVQQGNTLYGLAKDRGTTVADIQRLNPSVDPRRLQIGQTIKLPTRQAQTPATKPQGGNYLVVSGDTFSGIAKKHGVPLAALQKANPQVKDINKIRVGEQLSLPASTPAASDFNWRIVPKLSASSIHGMGGVESRFGKYLRNPKSSATGYYQMLEGTYKDLTKRYPELAKYKHEDLDSEPIGRKFMDAFYNAYVPAVQKRLGRYLTEEELIAMWNQGPGGYMKPAGKAYAQRVLSFKDAK